MEGIKETKQDHFYRLFDLVKEFKIPRGIDAFKVFLTEKGKAIYDDAEVEINDGVITLWLREKEPYYQSDIKEGGRINFYAGCNGVLCDFILCRWCGADIKGCICVDEKGELKCRICRSKKPSNENAFIDFCGLLWDSFNSITREYSGDRNVCHCQCVYEEIVRKEAEKREKREALRESVIRENEQLKI